MRRHPRAGAIPAAGVSEGEDDRSIFASRSQGLETLEGDSLKQRRATTRSKHQLFGVVADVGANCGAQLVGRRLRSGQTFHVGAEPVDHGSPAPGRDSCARIRHAHDDAQREARSNGEGTGQGRERHWVPSSMWRAVNQIR